MACPEPERGTENAWPASTTAGVRSSAAPATPGNRHSKADTAMRVNISKSLPGLRFMLAARPRVVIHDDPIAFEPSSDVIGNVHRKGYGHLRHERLIHIT